MPINSQILITGATGNVGMEIIQFLRSAGVPVAAAVRQPQDGLASWGAGIEKVVFDFARPDTYAKAFTGVKKLFLMRPPAISDVKRYIYPVIDAAKAAGVEHIVFLSLMGVEDNKYVPHYKIEQYLLASGMGYTFLRPSFFMQNLSTTHRADILEHNDLFVPAGKGKTSFIDVRDIAEVGAKALTEAGHLNRAYELSGNEALDYYQAASIFTEVLGREITYPNPSIFHFAFRMRKRGMQWGFIGIMIALYTVARLGLAAKVTNQLENLLGKKPITLRQFVQDYKNTWMPVV